MRHLLVVLCALTLPAAARATVTEPNGLVVPRDSQNGEVQLYTMFQQRGEAIDWRADAHTVPAVFSPLCGFTAQFVLHQAGSNLGFAWYNADPNNPNPPPINQIYTLIPANSPVGTIVNSANILKDPRYKGGEIGFALIGNQTHYSEQRYNPTCGLCQMPGPWALAVMYQSKKVPNGYYVAFEDGNVSNFAFNNDGDFNDDVYLVTGVECSGAGMPCKTGLMGVCGDGLTNCDANGALTCKQESAPGLETCDGLDNDCNGMVDDGAMCPQNQVCDRGRCVDKCGASEFQCDAALVCDNGVCVEQGCVGLKCPAGQVCHGGKCAGACDGVVCPFAQTCRAGRCVDPCSGVKCAMNQICQSGVCVPSCACAPCAMGLTCAMTGTCVDPQCQNLKCAAGMHCKAGICVDDCNGATCPKGQICQMGQCIDFTPPDMSDTTTADFAATPSDDANQSMDDDAGSTGKNRGGNCACHLGAAAHRAQSSFALSLILLSLLLAGRRASHGRNRN